MNTLFTYTKKTIPARFLAAVTMVAMILSAFPASFFVAQAASPTTLFSEDFEDETLPQWTSVGPNWDTVGAGPTGNKVRMTGASGDTGNLRVEVSTAGFENVTLSFDWNGKLNGQDTPDTMDVKFSDGSTEYIIETFDPTNAGDNTWKSSGTIDLDPAADDNADFELIFNGNVSAQSDRIDFDNILLEGTPIENKDDGDQVEPPKDISKEDQTGIRVCKIIVDEDGDIVAGDSLDSTFSLDLTGPDDYQQTVEFTTGLSLNTDLVDDNGEADDAECVTYELAPGNYQYADEVITGGEWEVPRYHDYHNDTPDELSDFGEMVAVGGEGVEYQKNFDGSIELKAEEIRTIAIVNTRKESEIPELEIPERCGEVVDEFTVPADSGAGTDTSLSLEAGRDYFAVVAGTYTFGAPKNGNERLADAEYSLEAGDTEWAKEFSATKPDVLDLFIDGTNPDFGAFRADHTYGTLFTGTGAPANFSILDAPYRDNDGSLAVTLYECEPVEVPACEIGENLLENGSFEVPMIKNGWTYTAITDWMITALDDGATQDGELHRGWSGNQAAHGEQYAELDSRESIKMAQTVVDLVEGATYELKWAFAPRHNLDAGENQLSVQVDGEEVATEGPASGSAGLTPGDWTRNTHTFKADSSSVEIAFADVGMTSDSLGTFLDDAALCFVRDPEPTPEEPDICSDTGVVVSAEQGLTNGGDAVDADRSETSKAADGVASYNNWGGKEPSWSTDDFYSLGINGTLVYEFTDKIAVDQAGADIAIWEITGGNSGVSNESADVYLSENGVDFELAGTVTGDGTVDIADTSLSFVRYVKLIDQSNGVQGDNGDGYDVDAITIIDGSCDDFVTVSTSKIVCDLEDELPDWGGGADKITADTAAEWLDENDDTSCRLVDGWEFEWAPKQGTSNPGNDLVGPAGDNWTTFGASVTVPLSQVDDSSFWVREVLQEGYIPFGGSNQTADESAELYCHTDGLNYDNYDRVDTPQAGGEYYCVAWNVPAAPAQCELDIHSDEMTLVEDTNELAVATYDGNDGWTADIPGATWIWATEQVENPEEDETYTFVETFTVENPTEASITIAHDNWLVFSVNGTEIDDRTGTNGYQDYQKQTYDILDELVPGENRIEFVVTNEGKDGDNALQNPAGLLFHLSAKGDVDSCARTTMPEPDETYVIDGYKFEGQPQFEALTLNAGPQKRSGWEIELFDSEGNYIDATSTDETGYYYFEVPAGNYEVREVMQDGWEQFGVQSGLDPYLPVDNGELEVCRVTLPLEYRFAASLPDENEGLDDYWHDYWVETESDSDFRCDFYNVRTDGEEEEEDDEIDEEDDRDTVQTSTRGSRASSGTRVDRRADPQPLVAGESVSQCEFLNDHMQMGIPNDRFEVMKLQLFLQMIMGYEQPITGFFGAVTDANVKRFQEEYRSEILDPWYERGIVPHNRPTGFVYKTTKWKINDIVCPGWDPYPTFDGEDLTHDVDIDVAPIPD